MIQIMRPFPAVLYLILAVAATAAAAQDPPSDPVARWQAAPTEPIPASEVAVEACRWRARAVIVFADSSFDPSFQEQMELLEEAPERLVERDVVIITDTDPAARTNIRMRLRPHGFSLVLLSKEGQVQLRKPFPWSVREIAAAIDKWPIRQREIEQG